MRRFTRKRTSPARPEAFPPARFFCLLVVLALLVSSCTSRDPASLTPTPGPEVTTASPPEISAVPTRFPTSTPKPPPTATATLFPGAYRNPVLDHDFPDPEVLLVDGVYYAFATNSGGNNIQVARSTDLMSWDLLRDALPRLPEWAVPEFGWAWAPGVAKPEGNEEYVMYYTARFAIGSGGTQCIGVATSQDPDGPYRPQGSEPFICQRAEGGSIDAHFFTDVDGSQYLLWKSDSNSQGGAPDIYIQPVSEDGLSLEGEPVSLMTVDRRWEGVVIEGPVLWEQEGKYYLFYSANDYTSPDYAVGYAVADSPTGPYVKAEEPLLKTTLKAGIVGPGGQEIVISPEGETWMLFHTWTPGAYRALALARLEWERDAPVIRDLTREPMPGPQAEPVPVSP